jgi:hypothetical protein
MWMVWGVLAIAVLGVKIYSGSISKNEDDHLILDEAFANMKTEQAALVERVHRLAPVKMVSLGLFIAASLFVAGYYILDIINQFK